MKCISIGTAAPLSACMIPRGTWGVGYGFNIEYPAIGGGLPCTTSSYIMSSSSVGSGAYVCKELGALSLPGDKACSLAIIYGDYLFSITTKYW